MPGEYFFYKAVIAQDGENNPVKALQFLDLVPQSDAHYSQALQFRIQLLYGLGREQEAVDLMEQGKRLFPGQSRFPLLQANYLISKKRVPEAIELLKTALEARPEDEDLLDYFRHYWGLQALQFQYFKAGSVDVATMTRPICSGVTPAAAIAFCAASKASMLEVWSGAARWRWQMPVRERIHSSEVSTH